MPVGIPGVLAIPGTSTTKHSVDPRPAEEKVTYESWDDAGADDTVSDHTTSMPGALHLASPPSFAPKNLFS